MKKILIKLLTLLAFFASSITALTTTAFADQYPDLCPLLNRTMKIGTQGPDVKRLQVVLGQEGIAYLGATGYYGTVTSKAVKTFQLRNGITSTGNVGPITLARMRSLWCTDYYTNGGSNVPDSGYYQPTPTTVAPNNGYYGGTVNVNTNTGYAGVGTPDVSIMPTSSSGANVTVSWQGTNVSSCTLNGQPVPTSGNNVFNILSSTVYTINCQSVTGQTVSKQITIQPNQDLANLPSLTVSINPTSALINTYATIYWVSKNTSSCNINNQTIATSGNQQVYVTSSSTAYKVTCTGLNGQQISSTISTGGAPVLANQVMTATISASNTNLSSGGSTLLTWSSTNASSCTVTGGNSNFTGLSGTQTVTPSNTTIYTITCAGQSGGTVSNQVSVTVNGTNGNIYPTLTANPQSTTSGQTTTLNWTVSNASYCVLKDSNGNTILSNQPTTGSTTVNPTTTTTYQITCYNSLGQTGTASVTVNTNGSGGNGSLLASPTSGNTPLTVTFNSTTNTSYFGGVRINYGDNTAKETICNPGSTTCMVKTHTYSQAGTYTAYTEGVGEGSTTRLGSVTITVGSGNTGGITVTGYANPTNVTYSGQPVSLSWTATGAYYCSISGAVTVSNLGTNGPYTVYPTGPATYTITCFNSSGQSNSQTINVTYNGSGGNNVTVSAYANPTYITYSGQPVVITWSSTGATSCFVTAPYGAGANQPTSGSVTIYPTSTFTSTVTCTNSSGASNSQNVTITYGGGGSAINFTANPTYTSYSGQAVTLSWQTSYNYCSVNGTNVNLYNQPGTYSTTVYPTQTSTYYISCSNYGGTPQNGSVTVTVNGGGSGLYVTASISPNYVTTGQTAYLSWSSSGATSCSVYSPSGSLVVSNMSATMSSYAVTPTQTGNYTVNCYNGSSTGSATAYVTVNGGSSTPSVTVTPTAVTISSGQTTYLTFSVSNASYCTFNNQTYSGSSLGTVAVAPTTTTTYTATCYNSNGVSTQASATVTVSNASSVSVNPTSITINSGASTVLTLTKANIATCSVTGGIYTNFSMGTNNTITVSPTQTTTYTFTCTDNSGGTQTTSSTVSVATTQPQLTLNPENKTILYGESVSIAITKQNIASCTIQGGAYTSATNIGSVTSITVNPTTTTTYTFSCTGNNGSNVTKASIITVNSTPSITVTPSVTTVVSGSPVTLTIARTNTSACTISGGAYSSTALSNSTTTMTVNPTTTTTYSFSCTGVSSGTANASVTITVTTAPTVTVSPTTQTISSGQTVTFTLTKNNINTCSINGQDIGALNTWVVAPTTTTTYNFTCTATTGGTVSASSLITVQ